MLWVAPDIFQALWLTSVCCCPFCRMIFMPVLVFSVSSDSCVQALDLNPVAEYASEDSSLLLFCRLGEVTLKDFKAAIDREGTHRYHFKALDPEFGTVKEEVCMALLVSKFVCGSQYQQQPGNLCQIHFPCE